MLERINKFLLRRRLFRVIVRKLKETSLPGFEGIPIWDVGQFFWQETRRDRLTVRASSMAFSFLLATFPGLLFFFTLIPYIPIEGFEEVVLVMFEAFLPGEAMEFINSLRRAFEQDHFELLSVGFVLAFFFATNGVNSMIASFNKRHPSYVKRNFWQVRGAAIRLTAYIFVLFIGSLLLIIGGRELAELIQGRFPVDRRLALWTLSAFRWMVIVFLYFSTISMIYHYGPARKQKWTFVTAGSTLATVLSIIATLGFAFFVNRFGVYNQFYGSIGALIVFMIWMNINTFVLLVGFELNNSIDMNRHLLLNEDLEAR